MSVRVMADVWDFGPEDPIDNSVLLRLANHCNDQGRQCFPSIEEVAKKVRRSERTVSRSIAQLEADGWLTVERGRGQGKTSHYIINTAMLKTRQADTFQGDERCQPRQQKVTATTTKGDSGDIPSHSLNGVTVNEPSGEPSRTREARPVPPAPESMRPVNPDAGEEMLAAVWFFEELGVPSDFGMRNLAAQAIRMQAREWGGIQNAAERMLEAARRAKSRGETRWRFWLTDQGYLEQKNQQPNGEKNGIHQRSVTKQRVDTNIAAIAKALERRGIQGIERADRADGAAVSGAGLEREPGGIPGGPRTIVAEILAP